MSVRKWVEKYVREQFSSNIEKKLVTNNTERATSERKNIAEEDESKIAVELIFNEMINSEEINEIIKGIVYMKTEFGKREDNTESKLNLRNIEESLSSIKSDDLTSLENWCPSQRYQAENNFSIILDKIAVDKPVHVRLAGFEALLENDMPHNCNNDAFELLLKLLRDGIADSTKSVFESSLRIHAKLFETSRSHDVYTNLLNAFESEYQSKSFSESLPNFNTGINFKVFLHEKLLRILYVILKYQKENLKLIRNIDRTMEEMIDQFVVLLTHENNKNSLCKTLSVLNLVSLLEPSAGWSEKWIHSVATRKTFIAAVSKSPTLLQMIFDVVKKGLEQPMHNSLLVGFSIVDDVIHSNYRSVFLSGDTVEIITYLHCINFVSQINICFNGVSPQMSSVLNTELPISPANFLMALVNSLNAMATSAAPKTLYNISQHALKAVLSQSTFLFDSNLGHVSLIPLFSIVVESHGTLWPHTLDLINFMLNSKDGLMFFTSPCKRGSGNLNDYQSKSPITSFLHYASNLLRQPLTVMSTDHVIQVLELVGKCIHILDCFPIIYTTLENDLYPAVEFFFNKIQKHTIGQENTTQCLDSAIKNMLLKIVAHPLALQLLSKYPATLEELLRSSINPLRHSWSSNEIVSFISSVTYCDLGCKIIIELLPHTLSMLLSDIHKNIETEENFVDPWDSDNVTKFIHILSLFSLNTKCFVIFLMDFEDIGEDVTNQYPETVAQIMKHSMMSDSPFHYFSLLSLEAVIWNLDILIHLLNMYDLQAKLLQLQENCLTEVSKYVDKNKCEENEDHYDGYDDEYETKDKHTIHLVDECSMLRSRILSKSYFIRHKLKKPVEFVDPEKCTIYSMFPPPTPEDSTPTFLPSESASELDELLEECKPGLLDSGWVMQVRKAHRNSPGSMKHSTLINLLIQMEKAIPAVEWVDIFKWNNTPSVCSHARSPEEDIGFDFVVRCIEDQCENPSNELILKENLRQIFKSTHEFIKYEPDTFFEEFDWFLGTAFIVSDGNLDTCKNFVKNFVKFPSAIYAWPKLAMSFDTINNQRLATQFILAQQIDVIVSEEFPAISHAMKNDFGIKWWMICTRLLSQCFWGILEWSEIVHFLAICILNPPDQIVYYCISLLQHCETQLMQDIMNKKYWPENIDLSSYQCQNYVTYMDQLAKKYRNNILPLLNQTNDANLNEE